MFSFYVELHWGTRRRNFASLFLERLPVTWKIHSSMGDKFKYFMMYQINQIVTEKIINLFAMLFGVVIVITDCLLYVIVDCQRLSSSGLRWPFALVSGMNYHATSHRHCPCEFSAVIWRLIFSAVLFSAFCSACEVTHLDTLIVFVTYLCTYLLAWNDCTFVLSMEPVQLKWRRCLFCTGEYVHTLTDYIAVRRLSPLTVVVDYCCRRMG